MLKGTVVLIGIGEMGALLARGLLRAGHAVVPVNRGSALETLARDHADAALVLVAVGENDLDSVLQQIPVQWRDRVGLLQNELLPNQWQRHSIVSPTVISIWFEKKPGQEVKLLLPSPAYGPGAELLREALQRIDLPVAVLDSERTLLEALVVKNLYILTTNICGLRVGGNVGELWLRHQPLARKVAADVLRLQTALTGEEFDETVMLERMLEAFRADPEHRCMGRSAPQRLQRALEQARAHSLALPALEAIEREAATA